MICFRSSSGTASTIRVEMNPGATAFTVMPREATSRATVLVNPMSPALAAV